MTSNDKVIPIYGKKDEFEVIKQNPIKIFKCDYARLGPFLTAKARAHMSEIMLEYEDKIQYSHTDSFLVNEKVSVKTSKEIGGLKLEEKGSVNIKNKNIKVFNNV